MKNEKGFTLIELLIVIAIIGILAAIAVPQFTAYRAQSFCASVESDVKNTVIAEEAFFVMNQAYGVSEVTTSYSGTSNTIVSTMNVSSSGTVVGSSALCVRPGGSTFEFTQVDGKYSWR
jgi:type IV pilus assembly protein PilA